MKSLASLAVAAMLMAAATPAQSLELAASENWPSCLGQQCCDLIGELPISQRSAFRAQHAYCQREDRDGERRLIEVK